MFTLASNSNLPLRVAIADDEPLSLASLRHALDAVRDVVVVAEATSGAALLDCIASQSVDVVFLDIMMPDLDGLAVAQRLHAADGPAVVFVTGHQHYAVSAFDSPAVDYLVKPVDFARLVKAVNRARIAIEQRQAMKKQRELLALLRGADPTSADSDLAVRDVAAPRQLTVRDGHRIRFVAVDSIDWIESFGNYAKLHLGEKSILHRETTARLESQLAASRFARIHKSAIVNLAKVAELRPAAAGQLCLVLFDGTALRVSRRYRKNVDYLEMSQRG